MEKIAFIKIASPGDYIYSTEYFVIADVILRNLYTDIFPKDTLFIKAGEDSKTQEMLFYILEEMNRRNLTRNACMYIIGGGTISDVGAFAAGIYKRGIKHVIIPTTLLAMTDAAVGGKCGINFYGLKNNIGIFKAPEFVIIDENFIKTLDKMTLNDGLVEGIKLATLFDGKLAEDLLTKLKCGETMSVARNLINYAPLKKHEITVSDFEDHFNRQLLNAGHTVGHFIESKMNYNISHGKAVAIGLYLESLLGYSSKEVSKYFKDFYEMLYGELDISFDGDFDFSGDKKRNSDGTVNLPVITEIGKSKIVKVDIKCIEDILKKSPAKK